jgi:hypothetical protein
VRPGGGLVHQHLEDAGMCVGQVPADSILVAVAFDHEQIVEQHEAVERGHGKFGAHWDDADGEVGQVHRHEPVKLAEHRFPRARRHVKRCLGENELELARAARLVEDLLAANPSRNGGIDVDVPIDG